jgi:hypothetical protein
MKKLALLLIALLGALPLWASFEPTSVGAREAGMADAATAMVDDVYSAYYNPAGLAWLKRPELGANYSRLFSGLSDNSQISQGFVGYGQPLGEYGKYGTLGADYITLVLPGLYQESTYGLSYAKSLGPWNLGGSIKMLQESIGTDYYTSNGINAITGQSAAQPNFLASQRSVTQPAFDLGVQYKLTNTYVLGGVMRNINQPNMSIGNDTDPAPRYTAFGIARHTHNSVLSLDFGEWDSVQEQYMMNLGGEYWLGKIIALRAGYGFGSLSYSMASVGASFRFNGFQLDYAMNYPLDGVEGTAGTQQLSFTIRFGKAPIDPDELRLEQEHQRRLEAQNKALAVETERDNLKSQVDSLTREQQNDQEPASNATLNQTIARTQAALQDATPKKREVMEWYMAALESYKDKMRSGATLTERKLAVKGILQDFKGGAVDLSAMQSEEDKIDAEIRKAKSDYILTLKYYEEFVKEGATRDERKIMLGKILLKFQSTGIDLTSIKEELQAIERLTASEGQ